MTTHTPTYSLQPSDYDEGPLVFPPSIDKDEAGRQLWIIGDYEIWAEDYIQALELAVNI